MKFTLNKKLSTALSVISIAYLIMAYQLPEYTLVPVDSDVIPKILGYILLFLSIILFFLKDEEKKEASLPRKEIGMLLGTAVLILFYIFLLEIVGFIIMTTLFIFVSSRFYGYKKYITNGIVSIGFSVAMYLLFNELLLVRLPSGWLPL
ncbi:tripartite tricarboxylate transporter TctB family protein [Oceanobacillus bengalensis]|uniref:Tripartite tricarboxylate transporter TctB family protein n=1 Tax=Oceanobacillus bengalensis TaxID=1435466 RepID=A0A494YZ73_9BACI|nr:tripartite tricarboxylate transporter TctB family protein [Oceanobacillus bengalensis]RKQ15536.1 tripartite tricarboxylate transporter TctB family protein [Oceanobacillus bengalensis]